MATFPVVKRGLIVHVVNCLWGYANYLHWILPINPLLIRSNVLSDSLQDTFKHSGKTKECNDGWLLLMLLDKVVKEKDVLRDSNFQHKCSINNLKASIVL